MIYIFIHCDIFFFFNQKTAYDMRISDLSSDVCSSDLTITRWWWAPDRCREQNQELPAVVQERFHSAANNRPPACSAAFGPVRHLGYGQLVDSPGIADRNRRTANRETRSQERRVGRECRVTDRSVWLRDK